MSQTFESSSPGGLRIEANPLRVRAMFAGHVIADTVDALTVRQPGHPPRHFFPLQDVETGYLGKTAQTIRDRLIGEGACYTLAMEGEIIERAACVYEHPEPGAEALRGRLCFDERHVEIYTLSPADMAAAPHAVHVHRLA